MKNTKKNWNTTKPPKRTTKPVKLRFQDAQGNKHQGSFVWCPSENTWVECCDGPDGIGLYTEDGWKVLGWR